MTMMSERTAASAFTSVLDLVSILAKKESTKAPKEYNRKVEDFKELKEVLENENGDEEKTSKSTTQKVVKVLGYDLIDQSDNKRKKPITIAEAFPTFNVNGEYFYMLMRTTFSDYGLLKPLNQCLPVKVLEEYERFLLVEVRPHMSKDGFVSKTYKLCINKHDFYVGKVRLVKSIDENKRS